MLPNVMLTMTQGDSTPGIASGFATALSEVWTMFGGAITIIFELHEEQKNQKQTFHF